MTAEAQIKQQVRQFYDAIGWQKIGEDLYQNARYEDLRPVSREYLQRCHQRVGRYLPTEGQYLLDAGSGPIQYPEYLEYSTGFHRRVCLDISHRALSEARQRIAEHGYFVVGDIAHPPFRTAAFDGLVSLHTVHHLPLEEHEQAFRALFRMLRANGKAVVVYSWGNWSMLMRVLQPIVRGANAFIRFYRRLRRDQRAVLRKPAAPEHHGVPPQGTFTVRHSYAWFTSTLNDLPGFEIRVWRSVSTGLLRALIHRRLFGRSWLRLLYWLEERLPHFLGRHGQYPMILFHKPADMVQSEGGGI